MSEPMACELYYDYIRYNYFSEKSILIYIKLSLLIPTFINFNIISSDIVYFTHSVYLKLMILQQI